MAEQLKLAPNTLTFHFDRLRLAGLVTQRREGRSMIYAAQFETMNALLGFLTENCCQGAPEKCAPGVCQPGTPKAAKPARRDSHVLNGRYPMKRLHVHVAVDDLEQAVGFYAALFAAEPTVRKDDYAKWMLDDPRVNFAISTRGREAGLDHLGIQVESADELQEVYARMREAGGAVLEQGETTCCYAQSEKSLTEIRPASPGKCSTPLARPPITA